MAFSSIPLDLVLGLGVAVLLFVYLLAALLRPELF
ncbi:K(+)-transporting ATPase subunit F [Ancylobacter mangrovi]|uniref:K(+)-transporting ATPase subunit F n=1 Tax=Ancylobacter mangrovi TaxID=2972472 RepID=A0A9X2PGD2_9HYPH|nr:K(+)-transporting ATPase subunit F [Ancylobacter mangrovi]MCS0496516.1 K(+)-transporting ATPase subunit F [Ancylobacter mangrovi]MCS0503686.1 K(+)-transporting ATPase subunit F [Ancylobacter mangrovi]